MTHRLKRAAHEVRQLAHRVAYDAQRLADRWQRAKPDHGCTRGRGGGQAAARVQRAVLGFALPVHVSWFGSGEQRRQREAHCGKSVNQSTRVASLSPLTRLVHCKSSTYVQPTHAAHAGRARRVTVSIVPPSVTSSRTLPSQQPWTGRAKRKTAYWTRAAACPPPPPPARPWSGCARYRLTARLAA